MNEKETKPKGWFSRRHETNTAHVLAQQVRMNRRESRPKQTWNPETKSWEKHNES